jgi:hypothetical protein
MLLVVEFVEGVVFFKIKLAPAVPVITAFVVMLLLVGFVLPEEGEKVNQFVPPTGPFEIVSEFVPRLTPFDVLMVRVAPLSTYQL